MLAVSLSSQSEDGSACSIPGAYLMQSLSEVQVTVNVALSSQIHSQSVMTPVTLVTQKVNANCLFLSSC